jgi:[ribosomal protein S18]-alanine N-acetyltransferase
VPASLRPYRPKDFEAIHAIDQSCYPAAIAYSKWELARYLRLPGADCLVAELGGEPVGFVLTARERTEGHIITIDVIASHRRLHVGSALLKAVEKRLAEKGCTVIQLETATNNGAAISFWQRHGYQTRRILKHYYPGGVDAFSMTKSLKAPRQTEKEQT